MQSEHSSTNLKYVLSISRLEVQFLPPMLNSKKKMHINDQLTKIGLKSILFMFFWL